MRIYLRDNVVSYLKSQLRPIDAITDIAVYVCKSLNVHPSVYSLVVPVEAFVPGATGYFNIVYYKNPHVSSVFVSTACFTELEKAKNLALCLFDNSGKFMLDKRFVIERS